MTATDMTPTEWTPDSRISQGVRRWTLIVGIATLLQGLWAFLLPGNFYSDFPTPDADWVSMLGPFDDHLMRDFGSALAGLGMIAVLAGLSGSRGAVGSVMAGFVLFGVLHLIYHLTTFDEFSAGSLSVQIAALVLFVAIPGRVLVASRRTNTKGTTT